MVGVGGGEQGQLLFQRTRRTGRAAGRAIAAALAHGGPRSTGARATRALARAISTASAATRSTSAGVRIEETGEAPGAVGDDAHPEALVLVHREGIDRAVLDRDGLAAPVDDAHIGIGGAPAARGVERAGG